MKKKSRLLLVASVLTLALVFGSVGFVVAYYRYSGQIARQKIEGQTEQELLQALIKAQGDILNDIEKDNETTVSNYSGTINSETRLIYKTLYTQCEDIIEKEQKPTLGSIGLNEGGFKKYLIENQPNWEIESFSKEVVVLKKMENKVCPNHYLVSVNRGYIAVYKYDEDSRKDLIDQTDIPINILPTVDQEKLQKGILMDTMEEVNQLLEDYSS